MNEKTRTINLKPIKVRYTTGNTIPFGCIKRREATQKESLYILREILGLNIDLSFSDCLGDKESIKELKKEFTEAVNDFLDYMDYNSLCNRCNCYDEPEAVNFTCLLWLVSYCQRRSIF